jgi:hypothetical protein
MGTPPLAFSVQQTRDVRAGTGAGVEPLTAGINEFLPAAEGDADGPVSGTFFKVEPSERRRAETVELSSRCLDEAFSACCDDPPGIAAVSL